MNTAPTQIERQKGADAELQWAYGNGQVQVAVLVAQALAEQRTQYEALAAHLDAEALRLDTAEANTFPDLVNKVVAAPIYRRTAERIRETGR